MAASSSSGWSWTTKPSAAAARMLKSGQMPDLVRDRALAPRHRVGAGGERGAAS